LIDALTLKDLEALDPVALKTLILAQQEQYVLTLGARTSEIKHLKLQVEKLRHMLFGTSSEKVRHRIQQLEFGLEELEMAESRQAPATEPRSSEEPAAKPHRQPLPRTCRARCARTLRATKPARIAAASSIRSVKTWLRCWSMYAPASRLSAMCGA
jgi:hypothetical protein